MGLVAEKVYKKGVIVSIAMGLVTFVGYIVFAISCHCEKFGYDFWSFVKEPHMSFGEIFIALSIFGAVLACCVGLIAGAVFCAVSWSATSWSKLAMMLMLLMFLLGSGTFFLGSFLSGRRMDRTK